MRVDALAALMWRRRFNPIRPGVVRASTYPMWATNAARRHDANFSTRARACHFAPDIRIGVQGPPAGPAVRRRTQKRTSVRCRWHEPSGFGVPMPRSFLVANNCQNASAIFTHFAMFHRNLHPNVTVTSYFYDCFVILATMPLSRCSETGIMLTTPKRSLIVELGGKKWVKVGWKSAVAGYQRRRWRGSVSRGYTSRAGQ